MKNLWLVFLICLIDIVGCKQIYTPPVDEQNKFVIDSPLGWGYKTLRGTNGLIGVLWPRGTSFNDSDTVIFVFVQNTQDTDDDEEDLLPENLKIVEGKCKNLQFKFSSSSDDSDPSLSIGEKYFSGACGRTRIAFEERIGKYRLIICLVSSFYVSSRIFDDTRYVAQAYKNEIAKSEGIQLDTNDKNKQADN